MTGDTGAGDGAVVEVALLGSLRLAVDGRPVDVPGLRRRAVLALLALAAGRTVSTESILEAVWPGEVPASGRRALHSHVSRLRGHLGGAAGRLRHENGGYRLDLGPDGLDVAEVRALVTRARDASATTTSRPPTPGTRTPGTVEPGAATPEPTTPEAPGVRPTAAGTTPPTTPGAAGAGPTTNGAPTSTRPTGGAQTAGTAAVATAGATGTDKAADLLGRAVGLWRGPALAEFIDCEPLAAEAAALAELREQVVDEWLAARVAALVTAGDGGTGDTGGTGGTGDTALVPDARRAAAEAPLRERAQALLVRALAASGRQAEALRAGNRFRRRLAEETGLAPGDTFAALEQEVALGVLAPAPTARGRPMDAAAVARPSSPMVGRDHEVALLRRSLTEHRLTTVVGPGGVGKTRLALEVVADLADGTAEAAVGRVVVVELSTVERAEPGVVAPRPPGTADRDGPPPSDSWNPGGRHAAGSQGARWPRPPGKHRPAGEHRPVRDRPTGDR